ncbi:hypothetical protein DXG03_006015 [Asterophora parasitica]|uniref:Uncharacterized protein n=1 Tax=Asterophora parasitica TaxID=117018 RepID=A0A9P7G9W4_9AGAR|nr:hypothetical protein DXG03_006015 [Asterophora parasitica]
MSFSDNPPYSSPLFQPLEAWKSDYSLSETSQQELIHIRDELQKTLDQHNREISRLYDTIESLVEQRRNYELRMAKLSAAVAPYKKLPQELLSKIFTPRRS